MSFRVRLILALLVVGLVPLLGAGWAVRQVVHQRLSAQDAARADAVAAVIAGNVTAVHRELRQQLSRLHGTLVEDGRLRLAQRLGDGAARAWLLDWAATAMPLANLDVLQLQDGSGRILSSGQFRNDFGRSDSTLAAGLRDSGSAPTLVRARTPAGDVLALAAIDTFTVAGAGYQLIGGLAVDSTFLSRVAGGSDLAVTLEHGAAEATDDIVRRVTLREVNPESGAIREAALVLRHSAEPLRLLRQDIDRRFTLAGALALLAAIVAAAILSGRLTGPLRRLALAAGQVELAGSPAPWPRDRDDEIGEVARGLDAMTGRLRAASDELRAAERRAAVGDLARQLNHDIKNGLVPIRNVVRHLAEVAEARPNDLAAIFAERRGTLDSGLAYLETLARNYARLTPDLAREHTDLNAVVLDVVGPLAPRAGVLVDHALDPTLAPVLADRVALRRILENLVGNAVDSLPNEGGRVTVRTEADPLAGLARLVVSDTGRGMSRAELDAAFTDFRSTKTGGTGLGLTVVRRLVLDLQGRLKVETAPGSGARFVVEFPAATDRGGEQT